MTYRRPSFENDLFTATAYKRNYRNPQIGHLFHSGRSRPLKPNSLSATRIISTTASVDGGILSPSTHDSLQVHVQKGFANESAKGRYISPIESLSKSDNDKATLEACHSGDAKFVEDCLKGQRMYEMQNYARKFVLLEALEDAIAAGYPDVVRRLLSLDIPVNNRPWWSSSVTYGWLPLQFAVHRGDVAMTNLRLEAGANFAPMGSGTQPIHIASHRGSLEITSLLLSAGAAIDSTDDFV